VGTIVSRPQADKRPWWKHSGSTYGADNTRLAFSWGGPENSAAIVCCNGLGVSTFFWAYIAANFCKDHKVLIWDYRGHGASGRPQNLGPMSMADIADDLLRVLDAAKIERAILLGHSLGCQTIFEFYRLYPERVLALVPMLGSCGKPVDTFIDPRVGPKLYELMYRYGKRYPRAFNVANQLALRSPLTWPLAKITGLVHPDLCRRADLDPYLDHLSQLDLQVFLEMARAAQEHDATDMLGSIRVPTLIVAGERDLFTPRSLSVKMAAKIPEAELLEIPRGSHAALIEQPELINLRLEKFIASRILRPKAQSVSRL
jgi:pimeloyl-ACP methyl ester carboxylesterase